VKTRYNDTSFVKTRRSRMAARCELTGKGKQFGHNVSFSLRRTSKVWKPNLQSKTIIVDGKKVKMKLSTSAIRTLKKKGLISLETQKTAK
jgi:large subunit ribosomal protein L28